MEEGKSKIQGERIADLGSGLIIAKVKIANIKEQDINARIMKPEMFKQLVDNIKKRGQLESLPLCVMAEDKIEIISGHHRIRAAREAGMEDIVVILDISGLSRSQIAAKQIAHNAISGFDDQSTLKEIVKLIEDVDDMLESYIGKDIMGEPMAELEKLLSPKVEFDWKNITFTFLPHQMADLEKLISVLESTSPDLVGVAPIEEHKPFMEAINKYQKFANVKNTGAAIHAMVRCTDQMFEDIGYEESQEWVQLTTLFGSSAVPKEAADIITEAVKKMASEGIVGQKNKWQAIEYWAADFLAGR